MTLFLIYYGKLGSWGKSQIPVKSRTNHPHLMTKFWLAEMMSPIFQTGLSKAPNMWREEYLLFTLSCVDTTYCNAASTNSEGEPLTIESPESNHGVRTYLSHVYAPQVTKNVPPQIF